MSRPRRRGRDINGVLLLDKPQGMSSNDALQMKETRARMHGRTRVQQAARDAVGCADSFVRERPWCSVGTAAAVGIFIGALLSMRKS